MSTLGPARIFNELGSPDACLSMGLGAIEKASSWITVSKKKKKKQCPQVTPTLDLIISLFKGIFIVLILYSIQR